MENRIYDEKNDLWYELQGDYYIPCLTLLEEENQPIEIWGQRHARYLKQHCKVLYMNLLTSGKLIEGHDWAKFQKICSKKAIEEAKKHVGFTLPRN